MPPEERGRACCSDNATKSGFSRASLTSLASSAKRKRSSSLTTPAHCTPAAHHQKNIDDGTMFDLTPPPRRRFKRRNSKCASMFYQMISPTTLLELQRIAGETLEERSDQHEMMMTVPSLPRSHHDKQRRQESTQEGMAPAPVTGEEEEDSRWSCTHLRSQMPVTPRGPPPPTNLRSTPFPSTIAKMMKNNNTSTSTHSILAEALRLSSGHLDVMASALESHLDDNDDESSL